MADPCRSMSSGGEALRRMQVHEAAMRDQVMPILRDLTRRIEVLEAAVIAELGEAPALDRGPDLVVPMAFDPEIR